MIDVFLNLQLQLNSHPLSLATIDVNFSLACQFVPKNDEEVKKFEELPESIKRTAIQIEAPAGQAISQANEKDTKLTPAQHHASVKIEHIAARLGIGMFRRWLSRITDRFGSLNALITNKAQARQEKYIQEMMAKGKKFHP